MRKAPPSIEWIVAESDADWAAHTNPSGAKTTPAAGSPDHGRPFLRLFCWEVFAVLLVLVSAGGWWWRSTQATLAQPTTADRMAPDQALLVASVIRNQLAINQRHQVVQMDSSMLTGIQVYESDAHIDIALPMIDVQGDQAVVTIVTSARKTALAYRQTRFYRRTTTGWQQMMPDATLWGPERSLATPYFVFHFRQNDAPAVIAIAPQLDALYTTLWHNFGLPFLPPSEKLVVEVRITQPSGQAAPRLQVSDRFIVPSPAAYLAPVGLTIQILLSQSIVLPLLEQGLAKAREHYAIGWFWQPLLDGVRLWQVWIMELPLAVWREDVVKWLYLDLPSKRFASSVVLPDRYRELCTAHKLWMPSPQQLNIPLMCAERHWEEWFLTPWDSSNLLTRLDQFSMPVPKSLEEPVFDPNAATSHPGQAVALATLVEYAVTSYGRERLPVLLAGLGQYENWETLIPAVFGVSATEFEAGWQAYLAAQYGVPLSSPLVH